MYNKPRKFDEIVGAILEEMKFFNFLCELPLILRAGRKLINMGWRYLRRWLLLGFTTLLNILGHQRRFQHRA